MTEPSNVDVSIIIVNYNVKHFADQCLRSIRASRGNLNIEVIVVDNNSQDGSVNYLKPRFPEVKFIANAENIGFGRANNIALAKADGRYLLVLNPDTLLGEDSLAAMVNYMDENASVGAMGPKLLNRYGSFDKGSKRGLPTPWASFCQISGLAKLFPKSKTFGQYNLLYLDPERPAQVDALPGCCMLVRREAYEQVGGFDEDFFMYGEDIDWTYRIKLAGWEAHYAPVAKIVHFKGESTKRSRINRDKAFYGAMHLFVDKHFRDKYSFLAHYLINFGIVLAWAFSRLKSIWTKFVFPAVDLIGLWCILVIARWVRTFPFWTDFGYVQWGAFGLNLTVSAALFVQALTWVGSMALFGVYTSKRGNFPVLVWSWTLGFLVNSSLTYFLKQFAYSRFAILFGFIVGFGFVWGWKWLLNVFYKSREWKSYLLRNTLIIGVDKTAVEVWKRIREDLRNLYSIVGFIDPSSKKIGSLVEGLPVIGDESDLDRLIQQEQIEEIIFAYEKIDYDHILNLVSIIGKQKNVAFKIITPDLLAQPDRTIPLLSVEYLSPRSLSGSIRKVSTIVFQK